MKIQEILTEDRKFYITGFPNKRGKFRITSISKDEDGAFNVEMGKNGTTVYSPSNNSGKLRFSDDQLKPMTAGQILAQMNKNT